MGDRRPVHPFFMGFLEDMLETGLTESPLYIEYAPMLEHLGLQIVEINQFNRKDGVHVLLTILAKEVDTTVDHCADVYRLLFPRLQLAMGEADLHLEVSTPGLERNFRDQAEFALFEGRRVRIYDTGRSTWVSGIIGQTDDEGVMLSEVFIEGQPEKVEEINMKYSAIQKAKLDYRWEDRRHGN